MEKEVPPFEFKQCVSIFKSTGKKAGNLGELRTLLAVLSDESISYHTYQYFLSGHVLEHTNDFAAWVAQSLGEKALSEHLSNIDPYSFNNIGEFRRELIGAIDTHLSTFSESRDAHSGEEFYFDESITLVFPARVRVNNLAEFLIAIKYIDRSSIYYHFYEARTRLHGGMDDFSRWFEMIGQTALAEKIRGVGPFMHTLEGIRAHIVEAVEDEVRKALRKSSTLPRRRAASASPHTGPFVVPGTGSRPPPTATPISTWSVWGIGIKE